RRRKLLVDRRLLLVARARGLLDDARADRRFDPFDVDRDRRIDRVPMRIARADRDPVLTDDERHARALEGPVRSDPDGDVRWLAIDRHGETIESPQAIGHASGDGGEGLCDLRAIEGLVDV